MILGEPPRSAYDLHFRLFGIPVRVHPLFWLLTVLLMPRSLLETTNARDFLAMLLPWLSAVFVSVLIHELGHAAAMRFYGRRPWITLYAMGGLTSSQQDGFYGSAKSATLREIVISVAGPAAGFVLAATLALAVRLSGHAIFFQFGWPIGLILDMEPIGSALLSDFIYYLLFVSIYWGVLNLLPIYPLDGGQIAREVFLAWDSREGIRRSLMLSVISAAALAAIGLLLWQSLFVAILFGYMAYTSYTALQSYRQHW